MSPRESSSPHVCLACSRELDPHPVLSASDRSLPVAGTFSLYRCPTCGSGTTGPLVPDDVLETYYPAGDYEPYLLERRGWRGRIEELRQARHRRRLFARTPFKIVKDQADSPGAVLDVGCGRGDLGLAFRHHGWSFTGLDFSAAACEAARGRGLHAIEGTLADADLQPGSFDLIVFQHCLEHLADPASDLELGFDLLKPSGAVAITVPNFGSWQAQWFGPDWYALELPRHRTHFTSNGLRSLLERTGFEVVGLPTSTSANNLFLSLQYKLFGSQLLRHGWRLALGELISAGLYPAARALDSMHGDGDFLHAVAVRPA